MENKIDVLLEAIKFNFADAQFEITHNSLSKSLKHFVIRSANGNKGFGADHNYTVAIHKAYSEFIERNTFKFLNVSFNDFKTSNGFSAHLTSEEARLNSIYELIERDAFLLSWHSKTAPYWLQMDDYNKLLSISNNEIVKNHTDHNLELQLGIIAKTGQVLTCIAKVSGVYKRKKFFFIDTKSGENLAETLNSLVESVSFFSHHIVMKNVKLRNSNFKIKNPIDHFFYYLNNTSISTEWFQKGSLEILELPTLKINSYELNAEKILGIRNLKRKVFLSESEDSQNYYCGFFNMRHINHDRFKKVFGYHFRYNKAVHPLS